MQLEADSILRRTTLQLKMKKDKIIQDLQIIGWDLYAIYLIMILLGMEDEINKSIEEKM